MFTHKEYLAKECTHREYYAQFVTETVKRWIVIRIGSPEYLTNHYNVDKHFNTIPLKKWDSLAYLVHGEVSKQKLTASGDSLTLAFCVCVLKEAAKQIVDEFLE